MLTWTVQTNYVQEFLEQVYEEEQTRGKQSYAKGYDRAETESLVR